MHNSDKPTGAEAGWHLQRSDHPYQSKVFRVRRDEIHIATVGDIVYDYQERGAAVIVVPLCKSGEIALIRQYRYPVDAWCLEVPAGGCHDTGDASFAEVAGKELAEELGATFEKLLPVGSFFTYPPMSDEECHVFLALGVELVGPHDRESTELIEIELLPAREAIALARTGKMKTAPCALALLLSEEMILASLEGSIEHGPSAHGNTTRRTGAPDNGGNGGKGGIFR